MTRDERTMRPKTDKSRQLKSRGRREVNREGENRQQAAKNSTKTQK